MLPDWVFRTGWGTPIARDYLQLRMEAAQLKASMFHVWKMRRALDEQISKKILQTGSPLRWAIKTSVPGDESGKGWGDLYFAQEIADALTRQGQFARVDTRNHILNDDSKNDDVVLVIRGVERIRPQKGAINLLWIISHPSRISNHELKSFDAVFAASNSWSSSRSKSSGVRIVPLLQATNPQKFHPDVALADVGDDLLFIGNSRHQFRQIIQDALAAGLKPSVYGRDWEEFIPGDLIKGNFIPNEQIASKYRSSGIVLNDHWSDMAKNGFYSNRLFDAAAAGARVVTDAVEGIAEVFLGAVHSYQNSGELKKLLTADKDEIWGNQRVLTRRAHAIGLLNSFDERVQHLVAEAKRLQK